jgi:hypothetical protein
MKFFKAFVAALVGSLVLSLASSAPAQTSVKQYVTVSRIEGQAQYSAGDNVWHPLVVGKVLGPGNVIKTAADSRVQIIIGDTINTVIAGDPKVALAPDNAVRGLMSSKVIAAQNVISMGSDTVLAIDKLSVANTGVDAASDTELDLRQGNITGTVKKLSAASQYLIKIPNGIAGIRGTTFFLSASGVITVKDGSAVISEVINGQTVTQTVTEGEQFDPATGQITQLTPLEMQNAEQTAVQTVTLQQGVISFANDQTTVYVSPNR